MEGFTVRRTKRVLSALLLTAMLIFLLAVNLEGMQKDQSSTYSPGNMPETFMHFTMQTLDGESFTAENFRDWRITVINGWGIYCKACVNEMPDLQALAQEYAPKGLQIVGMLADYFSLGYDDADLADAKRILLDTGISYPVLIPDESYQQQVYPMTCDALPATWLVNNRGEMVAFVSGSRSLEEWRALFDEYLALY